MIDDDVRSEFTKFGSKMRTIAICTILLIIPFVNIVAVIILYSKAISSLSNIKRINKKSKNKNLKEYRSFFLISYVIFLVGVIVLVLLMVNLQISINRYMDHGNTEGISGRMYDFQIAAMRLMLIVSLFMSMLQILAWTNLNSFFKENSSMFPYEIGNDAKSGSNFLKIAVIINTVAALGGLLIYFINFIGIVGFIMSIVGYFNLSALRNLYKDKVQSTTPGAIPVETDKNFCPNCGNPLSVNQKFCVSCGTKI